MSEHWFYMLRNIYTMENKQENKKYTCEFEGKF